MCLILLKRTWCNIDKANIETTTETRDGKKSYDSPPHSKEMIKMNKAFGRMHGASSLLNLFGLLATIWYGVTLSERIQ